MNERDELILLRAVVADLKAAIEEEKNGWPDCKCGFDIPLDPILARIPTPPKAST